MLLEARMHEEHANWRNKIVSLERLTQSPPFRRFDSFVLYEVSDISRKAYVNVFSGQRTGRNVRSSQSNRFNRDAKQLEATNSRLQRPCRVIECEIIQNTYITQKTSEFAILRRVLVSRMARCGETDHVSMNEIRICATHLCNTLQLRLVRQEISIGLSSRSHWPCQNNGITNELRIGKFSNQVNQLVR